MFGIILLILSGLFMGMMGSGGSILTLPLLLYILKVEPSHAIPLSIGIVGLSSFVGLILKSREKHVNWKKGFTFALFSMPFGFIGSKLGIFIGPKYQIMIFLALLFLVLIFMFMKKAKTEESNKPHIKHEILFSSSIGAIIGLLTGVVGVGGGFFIVPVFLYAEHLSFKDSAGTSLFVIFINSLSALAGYTTGIHLPWIDILSFGTIAAIGLFAGNYLTRYIEQERLRKIFAVSLIFVFIFTILKEYGSQNLIPF
ncbi:MAG: sulfite exporter TauE/SafE family protein [Leptospiraceae bacterium]|nr:sulfite exporter TauE/SafE family protein [Leptospiraceae bacterium]